MIIVDEKMKEYTHKELTRLVGNHSSTQFDSEAIEILVEASVKPDTDFKNQIELSGLWQKFLLYKDWFFEHTILAKDLALDYLKKAFIARKKGYDIWVEELGQSLHYIMDWGNPYHSPTSKANPVGPLTQSGMILGNSIETDSIEKKIRNISAGVGIFTGLGAAILYISHKDFEERCDTLFNLHFIPVKNKIVEVLQNHTSEFSSPTQLHDALKKFEIEMDKLRDFCDNLEANWISETCDSRSFSDYMSRIAIVMDMAIKIASLQYSNQ